MAQRQLSDSAFVYIMSSRSHRLYVGATTGLLNRVRQHKEGSYPNAFTARYKFCRLVYFEPQPDYLTAIRRERQIKGWSRSKKITLIQSKNPRWKDLSTTLTDLLVAR